MMKTLIINLFLVFSLILNAGVPEKPKTERLVNDFANILNSNQERALEQKLVKYDSQTSTQIAVVTISDLDGLESIEMATRIMKNWGVGGEKDNGIVIVFKPKTASSKGEIAITTGYGIEHLVTDALAKQVVEYDLIPYFKRGDIYGGFDNGTNVLMALTSGEFTGTDYLANRQKGGSQANYIFLVFIIIALVSRIGRARRFGQMSSGGSSLPFWLLMGMSGGSSRHSGSFSDFSSGGGSFGGFGGGFGGGGGASGSW